MESLPPPSSSSLTSNSKPEFDSGESRNWLDLPSDVVSSIFMKLDTFEILFRAHNVCTTWRKISKEPILYRTIDIPSFGDLGTDFFLEMLCRRAVDYSSGHLVDINIEYYGTDDLLRRIANSAGHLRRLRLVSCYSVTDEGLCEVAGKLPYLEELDISISSLSNDPLEAIGRCCPRLKTFKFNMQCFRIPHMEIDDEAFSIAKTMPELRHLQLFGNKMTNDGLLAILDGCRHLESLDIRRCYNINLAGSLGKRCQEQIKNLRLPYDDIDDYPFRGEVDYRSNDEDYPSGISDIDPLSDYEYQEYEFSGGSEFSGYDYDDDGNFYDF